MTVSLGVPSTVQEVVFGMAAIANCPYGYGNNSDVFGNYYNYDDVFGRQPPDPFTSTMTLGHKYDELRRARAISATVA